MVYTSHIILLLSTTIISIVQASTSSSSTSTFVRKSSSSSFNLQNKINDALEIAKLEQNVEDYNAQYVASCSTKAESVQHRRLICLPLDERFDPPMGAFSHGHVQTGDKMSLPKNFWASIQLTGAEVPWLFEVSRIDKRKDSSDADGDNDNNDNKITNNDDDSSSSGRFSFERVDVNNHELGIKDEYKPYDTTITKVIGGAIDFRAPANYCFLPWWMMRSLGLRPRDVVNVSLIQTIPPGSAVQLRPHSSKFVKDISNTQAVLETELKHYSSLVKGSTIAFDYNKQRYWFDVVSLRSAPKGEKVPWAKVQDCDVATEFVPSKEDVANRKKKRLEAQRRRKEMEEED